MLAQHELWSGENRLPHAARRLTPRNATIFGTGLALGAFLRLYHLDAAELSNDEAASWVSATVPNISGVIRFDYHANPGKLAFHTILLHLWMSVCGDAVSCLRLLSACFGVLALVLIFFVTRELLTQPGHTFSLTSDDEVNDAAALSVLICSVMLVLVRYSREARMYGLLLALVLAQVLFFLRARRAGKISDYAAMTLFTALAIGTNMTALLVVASEGVWLLIVTFGEYRMRGAFASLFAPSAALMMGLLLLLPFTQGLRAGVHGLRIGALDWIAPPARWEPFASFESATGSLVFPLMAVLAVTGVVAQWRRHLSAILFALTWMWLPPIALLIMSYFSVPILVTRYMLSSFVPFFILAALGLSALKPSSLRWTTFVVLLTLALIRIHSYYRKPHDEQVREAVQMALTLTGPVAPIAVLGDERHAARYYFPASERGRIQVFSGSEPLPMNGPRFLILAPSTNPSVLSAYPHLVAHFRGVDVRDNR